MELLDPKNDYVFKRILERYRAIARERALIDHATLLGDARETGRTQGKAEALARQLAHRFGPLSPSAQATISSALEPQLDAWLEGIFEAVSVESLITGGTAADGRGRVNPM